MAKRTLSQQAAFIDDFAHPERGHPGIGTGDLEQAVHDAGHQLCGTLVVRGDGVPDGMEERREALFDERVQQLLTAVEPVVDHRGRHSPRDCDLSDRGIGDAALGKQLYRGVQQLPAAVAGRDSGSTSGSWGLAAHGRAY